MTRPKSDAIVRGFSLIEATAAVALTATIVISLSSVAGQWLPNWSRGFVGLQRADLLSTGLELLAQDISAAEYITQSADGAPLFEGEVSSVVFVRSAIGPNTYPHLEVVRIAEAKDDRGLALTRTRAPFAPRAREAQAQSFAFGDPVALIRAPFQVSFAYAGPDRVWVASWIGREQLPDAVRITVHDAASNGKLAVSTAVRLRVTAQAPKLEAEASGAAGQSTASCGPGALGSGQQQ
jgi:general secretion pathway protein J